eukprot:scaffold28255_cov63-Phaeocystis_antarctica.AAC.3
MIRVRRNGQRVARHGSLHPLRRFGSSDRRGRTCWLPELELVTCSLDERGAKLLRVVRHSRSRLGGPWSLSQAATRPARVPRGGAGAQGARATLGGGACFGGGGGSSATVGGGGECGGAVPHLGTRGREHAPALCSRAVPQLEVRLGRGHLLVQHPARQVAVVEESQREQLASVGIRVHDRRGSTSGSIGRAGIGHHGGPASCRRRVAARSAITFFFERAVSAAAAVVEPTLAERAQCQASRHLPRPAPLEMERPRPAQPRPGPHRKKARCFELAARLPRLAVSRTQHRTQHQSPTLRRRAWPRLRGAAACCASLGPPKCHRFACRHSSERQERRQQCPRPREISGQSRHPVAVIHWSRLTPCPPRGPAPRQALHERLWTWRRVGCWSYPPALSVALSS